MTVTEPFRTRRLALRTLVVETLQLLAEDADEPIKIAPPPTDTTCLFPAEELPASLPSRFLHQLTILAHRDALLSPHRTFVAYTGEWHIQALHTELDRLNGFSGK